MTRARRRETWLEHWLNRLTLWRAVRTVFTIAVLITILGGTLARLVEPKVFTSWGLGLWWATETVTTVGYGDIVPTSDAGRGVGVALMLVGISFIPVLSSVIVSTLISKRSHLERLDAEDEQQEELTMLRRIEERLAQLEAKS
jgi:voltage-gated potassium channel